MSAARDSCRWFFDALYAGAPQPSVIAVSFKTARGFDSRFPLTPAEAASMTLGVVDAYHRVTPIARRLDGGRRGSEVDAVAFPGVYADLDVNGSPDGHGGVVSGAFQSVDAAVAVASAVLEPTMIVASGYGVQPYYLLAEMLPLDDDEDRARAKLLGRRLHARLQREARERGVQRTDSVFDLARILRPPGSLNGKGTEPRLVELLDDGGRRYTLDELDAAGIDVDDGTTRRDDRDAGPGRPVDELLDAFPLLARIARRHGTRPGKGSASDWDFMLGCRAAELGCTDGELGALIRHARQVHGDTKGERDDYVERTVAAVRERVGYAGVERSETDLLDELTKAMRLPQRGRHVVGTTIAGHGDSAAVHVTLDDGYVIEFSSFGHAAMPDKLATMLATTVGIATEFTKIQSRQVASLIRLAADRREEQHDSLLYVEEAMRLLRLAQPLAFDFNSQTERWNTWAELAAHDPEQDPGRDRDQWSTPLRLTADTFARRVLMPVDRQTGVRFVHAGWLQQFMRMTLGSGSTASACRQALLLAGWRMRGKTKQGRVKATNPQPGVDESLVLFVYLVAPGWEARQ